MAPYLCSRVWRWLACASDYLETQPVGTVEISDERHFAPADKLRLHRKVIRTQYIIRGWRLAACHRDERIFEAIGTWVSHTVDIE